MPLSGRDSFLSPLSAHVPPFCCCFWSLTAALVVTSTFFFPPAPGRQDGTQVVGRVGGGKEGVTEERVDEVVEAGEEGVVGSRLLVFRRSLWLFPADGEWAGPWGLSGGWARVGGWVRVGAGDG